MESRVTAKIKISSHNSIVKTLKIYKQQLQFCVDVAWEKKISNNIKLHPFVYETIRKKLPAQLAISCIKQACGYVKKAKTKPIIKNCSIRYNFPRSVSIKNNTLSLGTVDGRIKVPFTIPICYQQYFSWNVKESLLRIDKKGRCFFLFTFSKEVNVRDSTFQNSVLGVDLGVNNLAVTSDSRFYHSSKVKQIKRKFKHIRSILQSKGTRAAKKLLRKISGRENRYMTWVNHNISKSIVSKFNGTKIIMENLKGIRKKNKGKVMNYWISNWSFFQLQNFIQYKAERVGIEVKRVQPMFTSQICHRCGQLGTRSKGCFNCFHCNILNFNSDLNASRNLSHPMLVGRQAAVNQPYLTCNDSKRMNIVKSQLF